MKRFYTLFIASFSFSVPSMAQGNPGTKADSTQNWSYHFQLTAIDQGHGPFKAAYTGQNSLRPEKEDALSLTTTLFLGRKLWKGASVYFNPEIAGGRGISSATGIAAFSNGETFRIGNPAATLYLARLFYRQYIALGTESEMVEAGPNQLKELVPKERITITAGKFAISDIFDNNSYSHDPRTQFMNWALMSNGAWDYPANTRGYTDGIALEYVNPSWAVRFGTMLTPTFANGPKLDYNYFKAHGEVLELQKNMLISGKKGVVTLLAFRNVSKAPKYRDVINDNITRTDTTMDVINGKSYGGVKYGFGLNAEQALNKDLGVFVRLGWNDGKTATWAFTEIDRNMSAGMSYKGSSWHRPDDTFGLAVLSSEISNDHREFLQAGGYGFMIGDGQLSNYKSENVLEAYYQAKVFKGLSVTGDYQFVQHPGYNGDRGPVHVFAVRAHVEF